MVIEPVDYTKLSYFERKVLREKYIKAQNKKCFYCGSYLFNDAPEEIKSKKIDWSYFPKNFLQYPIHLQHNHKTNMTEGAVHNYCNAVMWQYENK